MNKQTLVVVIGAIVLLGLGVFGAMAFTGGSDSGSPVMTMPDGTTMPADQMTTSGGTHDGGRPNDDRNGHEPVGASPVVS